MLSVIIAAYNEEQMICKTVDVIYNLLKNANIHHEMIFINDGSKDRTWELICNLSQQYPTVKGVCFSKNFGKEAAMFAGLAESKGECCVLLDCDLQHPPQKIIDMYRLWEQGYEIVEGVKSSRGKESMLHGFAAKCFYSIISKATGINMENASDFKLLDRKAITVLLNLPEKNAFFRALSSWIGFKTISVEYDVQEREAGESKWSTKALIKYALSNITSFSSFPMQIVTFLGCIMFVISFLLGIVSLYQKMIGIALGGFTTVIILLCFIGSVLMISLGIIGYYISKIYDEIKGRPRYIVSCKTGEE